MQTDNLTKLPRTLTGRWKNKDVGVGDGGWKAGVGWGAVACCAVAGGLVADADVVGCCWEK